MFVALSILLAVMCVIPAAGKLSNQPKMVASAGHFDIPWPKYRMIGTAELAAAAGVIAGMAWAPIGMAAAAGMAVLLLGALAAHRRAGDTLKEAVPALVALAVSVAYLAVALPR